MNNSLIQVLNRLDRETKAMGEYEIASKIKKGTDGYENDSDVQAELIAFNLSNNYEEKSGSWGYYYGPYCVFKENDGSIREYPSLSDINSTMIDYWFKRMNVTKNLIMKARYADLVWEFKKSVTGDNPSHTIAQQVIDNNILIIEKELYKFDIFAKIRLKRILRLALSLKDQARLERIKNLIIKTEDKISVDSKSGLWGFSYDFLMNKKIKLDNKEKSKIINDLRDRMNRLSCEEDIQIQSIESAAIRLASYYQKTNNKEELIQVMKDLKNSYEKKIKGSSPIQAQNFLGSLHEIFLQFQLGEEARGIIQDINELGPQVLESLTESTHSIKLSNKELNDYVNQFTSGNIINDIQKISYNFVPKKDKVEGQVHKLAKDSPLGFLISKELLSNEGFPIAQIGNLENDLEGNIIHQISQNLTFESIFLDKVITHFIQYYNLNIDTFLEILLKSPVFEEKKSELLKKGIQMYFEEDYVSAMHILIPQVESAFRRVININGGMTLMPSKDNEGYRVKLFGAILSDPIIEKVFNKDYKLYFRILFSEQKGLNLRNNISHGLSNIEVFNKYNANLLIHVLLTLSLVRISQ